MILTNPVIITSRLLPGVRIGQSFISIEYSDKPARESHRAAYRYYLDLELYGKRIEHSDNDLSSGCNHSLAHGLASLLDSLAACGDSYRYATSKGMSLEDIDNGNLFPKNVAEWAYLNQCELSILACEIEENPDCINEDN